MTPEELLTLGDVYCRIKSREYGKPEGMLGEVLSGLAALPGYVSPGKRVTLHLECGWCIGALEEFSSFILEKPERAKFHHLVLPSVTHVRCPICSGDYREVC